MSSNKVTPRPWIWKTKHGGFRILGSQNSSERIASTTISNVNAAFIVKAVNLFDELVHACEKALERLEEDGSPYTRLLREVLTKIEEAP